MIPPIEVALIGAGNRGAAAYGAYALQCPEQARIVAVAEPNPDRRARVADQHDIAPERCFHSWEELFAEEQLAQAAIVATQDQMHVAPAIAAMERGYDVLLEKPMAHTLAGCVQLVQTAERTGRTLQICHVLRYAPFWRRLHEIIVSGVLGEIVTVEHRENVAYWHMAHSFVRGNWRNQALSNPMILAKCCHDLDVLVWNLGMPVERLSSVGSLVHFKPETVGPEIPLRCTDGCPIEAECPFSAPGIYLEYRHVSEPPGNPEYPDVWPYNTIGEDLSEAGRRRALETGPYGRCVFRCDNDVVDHQTVLMELANGASVTLVMHGHSDHEHRSMRYDGTRGTLLARAVQPGEIEINYHGGRSERIEVATDSAGHGGGDFGIMADFVRVLRGEIEPATTARVALESHLLAFAAEAARRSAQVVTMDRFRKEAELLATDAG